MRQAHLRAAQGDLDGATADFRRIAERLDALGEAEAEIAIPLRCEIALFFASQDALDEADALFQKACAQAEKSKDPRHLGNTCAAYGFFLQHHSRGAEAFDFLERAHTALKGEGFAALQLRLHLNALINGTPCGCSESADALTAELERRVKGQLPDGLMEALRIHPVKGIELSLRRPPTQEEQKLLQRAIPAAIEQIRAVSIARPMA